jgi:hypothetical protein
MRKYEQKSMLSLQQCIPFLLYYVLRKFRSPEFVERDMTEQQADAENYWQNEFRSLGIESKRKNKLTDREELQALAESIKQVYYQDYKTAYGEDNEKVKASEFGYII